MRDLTIIATLAGALTFALALGWATQRLGLSTLVGYMLAGIVVGPYTPGFVADTALASQMAEIGVVLLMFGVGMHSIRKSCFASGVLQSRTLLRRALLPLPPVGQVREPSAGAMLPGSFSEWRSRSPARSC